MLNILRGVGLRSVFLPLLLLQLPAFAQMKVFIQYQDQFGRWHPYQTKHIERDAYRTAESLAGQLAIDV